MAIMFSPIKGTILVLLIVAFTFLSGLKDYYDRKNKKNKKKK